MLFMKYGYLLDNESLCIIYRFFLSCPKPDPAVSKQGLVIGHPEVNEKTGFRLKDCRNDEQRNRLISQH